MNKVGIIEDLDDSFNDYKEIFGMEDIELIRIEKFETIDEIHKIILDKELEALIIDYKLKPKYNFLGTEIISKLNKIMLIRSHLHFFTKYGKIEIGGALF